MRHIDYLGRHLTIAHRSEQSGDKEAIRFSDQYSALSFLRNARLGGTNMSIFRDMLRSAQTDALLHQFDDHNILERLSRLLCSGGICLYEDGIENSPLAAHEQRPRMSGSVAGPAPEPAAPRREPRAAPPPPPRPEPAPKAIEPDMDIEQQIASLKAAAESGAPFCEKCERARLKREAAA
ncbi:MAG: hypothetical protein ACJA2X_000890 [Halocynthiibacter sp.]|jgi:hypothetical protein